MSRKSETREGAFPGNLAQEAGVNTDADAGDGAVRDRDRGAIVGTTERWWRTPLGRARLDYELAELDRHGIAWERDEESFAAGTVRLILHHQIEDRVVRLVVTFPDFYPFFRFEVEAPDCSLAHHQHPFGKALCLLGRATDNWHTHYTVAELITSQLPKTLVAGASDDQQVVTTVEEHQAEPFSDYYVYPPSMIQIDGGWSVPPDAHAGALTIGVVSDMMSHDVAEHRPWLQGVVLEIRGENNAVLAKASPAVRERYGRCTIAGRWSRVAAPIQSNDPSDVFERAAALDPDAKSLRWVLFPHVIDGKQIRLQVRGVLFPEEVAWRDSGDGWVFVIRIESTRAPVPAAGATEAPARRNGSKFIPHSGRQQRSSLSRRVERSVATYLSRAGRSGAMDLAVRIPELAPLRNAVIAVFGLGSLGAPSAIEFARGGARELRLLDADFVDPGAAVRWPLGMLAAGRLKTAAVQAFIVEHYPHTAVIPVQHHLGAARGPGALSDVEAMALMTRDVSLIYDATAEFGVQHFLSEYARERGIPYIAVTGTQGGWGGRVVRIRPGVTEGCWSCLQAARFDGTLVDPATKTADGVQPAGCANPTFTGAGFDMLELALHGVRLAVSTLSGERADGYPATAWDVAVISHRTMDGTRVLPSVQCLPLTRHPACPACAARASSAPEP